MPIYPFTGAARLILTYLLYGSTLVPGVFSKLGIVRYGAPWSAYRPL